MTLLNIIFITITSDEYHTTVPSSGGYPTKAPTLTLETLEFRFLDTPGPDYTIVIWRQLIITGLANRHTRHRKHHRWGVDLSSGLVLGHQHRFPPAVMRCE